VAVVDKDSAKVLAAAIDKVEAQSDRLVFFARVEVLDWVRTMSRRALMWMLYALCTHAGYLVDNFEGKKTQNRNGSYHIAKAPS
jgi:hypothetical protein